MSVDLGLYPPQAEDESTDDEFTENVWWETADNLAFVNDEGGPPITPVDQVGLSLVCCLNSFLVF